MKFILLFIFLTATVADTPTPAEKLLAPGLATFLTLCKIDSYHRFWENRPDIGNLTLHLTIQVSSDMSLLDQIKIFWNYMAY